MAIRDKVTVKVKSTTKPHVFEVKRPGGTVEVTQGDGLLRVTEMTRAQRVLNWAAYSLDEIKSIEFEAGS